MGPVVLRDYQRTAVDAVRAAFKEVRRVLYVLPTGGGKCLARGTPVLMFDGTIKPVEDVQVDDLLMGPDSQPRRVLSLARGTDQMYRVTPKKGDPYTVNSAHILSLKMTAGNKIGFDAGAIVNLTVTDYLSRSKTFRHCAKGWRVGVEFPPHAEPLAVEPYFLGLWLGDGAARNTAITTGDPEIVAYLAEHAQRLGMELRVEPNSPNSQNYHTTGDSVGGTVDRRQGPGTNPLTGALRRYDLLKNKHIPHRYKTGTRQERLEVLAGYLDADGHLHHNFYEISAKCPRLADDILFLARSLGLAAYVSVGTKTCGNNGVSGQYSRICISGHVDMIPCRIARKKATPRGQVKDALVHGLTVEPIGEGEYFGFEIDRDRLFLLGDFTVTHNTVTFSYIVSQARRKGKRVVVVAHRIEIIRQISAALTRQGVVHGIIAPGHTPTADLVQVAMVQTLVNRLDRMPEPDLLVVDEAHHTVAGSWQKVTAAWAAALQLGVTATPERLDGRGLGGSFDQMVMGPNPRDLIDMGSLADFTYLAPPSELDLSEVHSRGGDYALDELAAAMERSTILGDAVEHYGKYLGGKPAIAFCISIAHAEAVAARFRAAGWRAASIDGTMGKRERESILASLEGGRLDVLTTADLVSEGFDVPAVQGALLLRPTKSLALFLQQVGRALRPKKDGSKAIILDHVGNCHRHGLPDWTRDWTLDGKVKRPKAAPVAVCSLCFKTLAAPVTKASVAGCQGVINPTGDRLPCPYLEDKPGKPRPELEEVDGELVDARATIKPKASLSEWTEGIDPATAKGKDWFRLLDLAGTDLDRLKAIERAKGYKRGWCKHQLAKRYEMDQWVQELVTGTALISHAPDAALWAITRLAEVPHHVLVAARSELNSRKQQAA
jgi:superfamily II DNA or RNA helicase